MSDKDANEREESPVRDGSDDGRREKREASESPDRDDDRRGRSDRAPLRGSEK